MKHASRFFTLICFSTVLVWSQKQEPSKEEAKTPEPKIAWQKGPIKAKLGAIAMVDVPEGYAFADAENTRLFLQATGNLPGGNEYGTIANMKSNWFVVFEFDESGYVKDDEKETLDEAALLKSLQEGQEASNERRKEAGLTLLKLEGWFEKPHYDKATNNLVWATLASSKDGKTVNHNMRLLGRRGVMSAVLVADPEQMQTAVKEYSGLIGKFEYNPDDKYSAFRSGDKIAEYGLSALVLGGAAAAAVKGGLLKTLTKFLIAGWKLVALALVGFGAAIKRLFTGRSPAPPATESEETPSA
ncbi:MAG: DUF2167 domain-containing protein [Bryobacteraceae bacterium]|nr:DUF2167 domain-containing protein [Bryobacteraceae bacterium]